MDESAIHRTLMNGHGEWRAISYAHGQVSIQSSAKHCLFAFVPQGPVATPLVHEGQWPKFVVCIQEHPPATPKRDQGSIGMVRKMADFTMGRRAFEHLLKSVAPQTPAFDDAFAIPGEKYAIGPLVKGKHRCVVACDFQYSKWTPARESPRGVTHHHARITPRSQAVASGFGVEPSGAVCLVRRPLGHNAIASA